MTSSLVGSEMCIRDRIKSAGGLAIAVASKISFRLRIGISHTGAARTTSVSYTHLTLPTICSV
eukprot:6643284-Prorocentrum_lima.AAC.1